MIFRHQSEHTTAATALELFEQHDLSGRGELSAVEAIAALTAATGVSLRKCELRERMAKFVRLHAGEPLRVDWITFLNLVNEIVHGATSPAAEDRLFSDAEVLEIFQAFDPHKKGYIRRSDLTEMFRQVMPRMREDAAASICERVDPLQSGHITFLQFRDMLQGEALDYLHPMGVTNT